MEPGSDAALADAAAELARSPVPALIMEVPTGRIVGASPSGSLVLDPGGGTVVGRNIEDFMADGPSGVLGPFAAGRVTRYETPRLVRRTGRPSLPVSVWVHELDQLPSSRFALAVFAAPRPLSGPGAVPDEQAGTVIGTTDATSHIERISNETVALFGRPRSALVGRPLTDLVTEPDRAELAAAVAAAALRNRAVTLYVQPAASMAHPAPDAPRGIEPVGAYELVIVPMAPPPGCAFVFVRVRDDAGLLVMPGPGSAELLLRSRRGAQAAGLGPGLSHLSDNGVPGLSELTVREWEIVTHLLDGDRVPAIATELFLSQSTVRSHLALVFDKLGVNSQQELLDLLHGRRTRAG